MDEQKEEKHNRYSKVRYTTNTDKKCPECGLWSTGSALLCDCGYDFDKLDENEAIEIKNKKTRISGFGIASFVIGIIAIVSQVIIIGFLKEEYKISFPFDPGMRDPSGTFFLLLLFFGLLVVPLPLCVLGIIVGIVGIKRYSENNLIHGIIISFLGIIANSIPPILIIIMFFT